LIAGGAETARRELVVENGASRTGWIRGALGIVGLIRHRSELADAIVLRSIPKMSSKRPFVFIDTVDDVYRRIGAN
jgi:hypothetical protein